MCYCSIVCHLVARRYWFVFHFLLGHKYLPLEQSSQCSRWLWWQQSQTSTLQDTFEWRLVPLAPEEREEWQSGKRETRRNSTHSDSYPVLVFQWGAADDGRHHGYIDVTFQSLVECSMPMLCQKQYWRPSKREIHSLPPQVCTNTLPIDWRKFRRAQIFQICVQE